MSRLILLSVAALGALIFALPEAQAQPHANSNGGYVVNDQLDKVEFFKARRQYQITDESPLVKDLRRKNKGPNNYVLNIGPVQDEPGQTSVINVGAVQGSTQSLNNGQPVATRPGQIVINADELPNAGFQPYVSDLKSPARGLPSGGFKNSLAGKMLAPATAPVRSGGSNPGQLASAAPASRSLFTYTKSSSNGSPATGSSVTRTHASVSGKLLTKKLSGQ